MTDRWIIGCCCYAFGDWKNSSNGDDKGNPESDDETASQLPEYIRRQGSGIQFGFDITFLYKNKYGVDTTYMIECKNYVNNRYIN